MALIKNLSLAAVYAKVQSEGIYFKSHQIS